MIDDISETADGGFQVTVSEPANAIYALGVLIGAIGDITGKTMLGTEKAASANPNQVIYTLEPF